MSRALAFSFSLVCGIDDRSEGISRNLCHKCLLSMKKPACLGARFSCLPLFEQSSIDLSSEDSQSSPPEAEQPGTQLASAQLSQLLFIQILRAHLTTSSPMPAGWLRALSDARIAPALRAMHADPARSWHLDELARACAMSRTTFAFHFREIAGVAPLTYLTKWRMRLAERALREETTPIAVIARSLGYSSESAFSNAFKRVSGKSPKAYRSDRSSGTNAHEQVPKAQK